MTSMHRLLAVVIVWIAYAATMSTFFANTFLNRFSTSVIVAVTALLTVAVALSTRWITQARSVNPALE